MGRGRERGKEGERKGNPILSAAEEARTHNSSSITHEIVQSKRDTCLDLSHEQGAEEQPYPFWKAKIKEQTHFKLPHDMTV